MATVIITLNNCISESIVFHQVKRYVFSRLQLRTDGGESNGQNASDDHRQGMTRDEKSKTIEKILQSRRQFFRRR